MNPISSFPKQELLSRGCKTTEVYFIHSDDGKGRAVEDLGSNECRLMMRRDATFGRGSKVSRA